MQVPIDDEAEAHLAPGDGAAALPHVRDRPTRRASLFGSVVGVYRSPVLEGAVTLTHCLGDEVADISQVR